MIVNNGWTQLKLLFDRAFKYTASGKLIMDCRLNCAADGTVGFTYMSKLPVCFFGKTCPIALINGEGVSIYGVYRVGRIGGGRG